MVKGLHPQGYPFQAGGVVKGGEFTSSSLKEGREIAQILGNVAYSSSCALLKTRVCAP